MGTSDMGETLQKWQTPSHIKKGSFWWRGNLKLLDAFKGMAMVNIQNGSSCLFWFDLWGIGATSAIPGALLLCEKQTPVLPNSPPNRAIAQSLSFTYL
jgi:hypothetical protein